MVVEILGSLAYSIVENSWKFATVFVKYLLVIALAYSIREENVLESFRQFLDNYSRESVTVIVLVGSVATGLSYSFSPVLVNFSSVIALLYFGYLFWKF